MVQHLRYAKLLELVDTQGYVSVAEASDRLSVSEATVRRDLADLARSGRIARVRGGAAKSADPRELPMVPFAVREGALSREKSAIAKAAAGLVSEGDTVMVAGGTTTFHLARWFPRLPSRVITNSTRLAAGLEELAAESPVEVYLTGGYLYPRGSILLGTQARSAILHYYADLAFIGAGGVTSDGVYNTNELVVETERAMMERAGKVVVLADHEKIGRTAMCLLSPLSAVDVLITDDEDRSTDVLNTIRQHGVEVIVADG
jgi:DeoR family ulaG and ulaABCDEF operon transcriptional repressor